MSETDKKYVSIDNLINIIMKVPIGTAYLMVSAKSFNQDGEPISYEMKMDSEMIAEARQDFLDNVEDGDDYDRRYIITDYGRATLEQARQSALQEGKKIYD